MAASERARDAASGVSSVSRTQLRPPVVLVADDCADSREMYAEYLQHLGYRVLTADDGERVLEVVRTEKPSIVVMDLSLPIIDGWSATRAIKSDAATAGVLVIVVSGHGDAESVARAERAGCDQYVLKPCLPAEIGARVRACLDKAAGRLRPAR